MASLKWNVWGLCEKIKRSAALAFLKKQRADVVVLVETHIEGRLQMALCRPWVGWAYHSTHTTHARGVSILIAKSVHFELCEVLVDPRAGMYSSMLSFTVSRSFSWPSTYLLLLVQLWSWKDLLSWLASPQY